ncbi:MULTISPECIES: GNAT family N-acetyltransferase [Paraliobacillus]|uniref:GNAT family N-acetyltransferase n=1 Tax=Paraliobacillus TaxID=200903 RepID=UPI000DD41A17|nr:MULTISPECIES: GNAT family N-acetyltransferase [Paraliobacillus]
MEIVISKMQQEHWERVKQIYEDGIATGNATFETKAPTWEAWDKGHLATCRLVALVNNEAVGWVALSPVSSRCVYQGVAEVSIYIKNGYTGKKIGSKLMDALIEESEKTGFWTLEAGVFTENSASLKLHQKAGFRIVGTKERISKMDGKWRDVVILERRSKVIGND